MGARRRLSTRAKLLVTAGSGLLGLLLCEAAVRVLDLQPPPPTESRGGLFRNVADEIQIYENRPGAVERLTYRDSAGDEPRTVVMRVNEQGFRGPVVERQRPAGVLRIACLGDSHTFGYGVTNEETWPSQLDDALDPEVEVMNCGVNAYDTMQELIWLRKRVLRFQPDLVLLQYYVNDTAARNIERHRPVDRDWWFDVSHPSKGGTIGWFRGWSRFADVVFDGIHRRRGLAVYSKMRLSLYEDESPGWHRVRDGLRQMRDELASRDIAFGVVLFPFLIQRGSTLTSHEAFEKVKAFCAAEGIECYDAEPDFLAVGVGGARISAQDYHANGESYGVFARAVARWLEETEYLGARN